MAMNLRQTFSIFLILLATSVSMLSQTSDPTGTGNQAAPNVEKGVAPIPVITGGIALNSSFDAREAALLPVVAPILLVPLGRHALIESEFEAESEVVHTEGSWQPVTLEKGVEYAQLDLFLGKYLTLVAGRYATPFNFYKRDSTPAGFGIFLKRHLFSERGITPATVECCAVRSH